MSDAQQYRTLPDHIKDNETPVLVYFKTPAIWIVCQWDDSEDVYNWRAIGSHGSCWSEEDAALWAPTPTISEADMLHLIEDDFS